MFYITVRIFPANRRASFSSRELSFESNSPTVSDMYKLLTDLDKSKYRVSRGVSFLNDSDLLVRNEILNILPMN